MRLKRFFAQAVIVAALAVASAGSMSASSCSSCDYVPPTHNRLYHTQVWSGNLFDGIRGWFERLFSVA
jgi:hypothetical protein